jgi:signal transduction histidine kinase
VRFDDTLDTVLAADLTTSFGKHSAWRQLVDLIGRGRVPAEARAIATLSAIRADVPPPIRAASARALEYANPPASLVRLLAVDEIAIAAPVLRSARLGSREWIALLPELSPSSRAVLRHRRDLAPAVRRALDSFGPEDFRLPDVAREPLFVPDEEPAPEPIVAAMVVADPEAAPEETLVAEAVPAADAVQAPEEAPPEIIAPLVDTEAEPEEMPAVETLASVAAEPLPAIVPVSAAPIDILSIDDRQPLGTIEDIAEADPIFAPVEIAVESLEPAIDWTEVVEAAETAAAPTVTLEPLFEPAAEMAEVAPKDDAAELAEATPILMRAPEAPFVSLASVALGIPVVAEALRRAAIDQTAEADETIAPITDLLPPIDESPLPQSETVTTPSPEEPLAAIPDDAQDSAMLDQDLALAEAPTSAPFLAWSGPETPVIPEVPAAEAPPAAEPVGPFQISEVVARIDAFQRRLEEAPRPIPTFAATNGDSFRFETDAQGVIRWVDGVSRTALIGLSLDLSSLPTGSRVDGVAAGAFRRRAGFSNARMIIDGESDAGGDWRISAIPAFDPANGRFTGYRGTARRPRADEKAEPVRTGAGHADALRQLVHELRTPTNAIAGFAEMIEGEMLGPVAEAYRAYATDIRAQARDLLGAIDDLDLAARIETQALSLYPSRVALRPLLATIADDLSQLATLRGSWLALPIDDLSVTGDSRAIERLLARLLATLVSASGQGERIGVRVSLESDEMVSIAVDRPAALADYAGDAMLAIDDEIGEAALLGTGFALRLVRNLARELGGGLVIGAESLTLRLPAAFNHAVGQAHLN